MNGNTVIPPTTSATGGVDLTRYAYAGFWERFAAMFVDFLILTLVFALLVVFLTLVLGAGQIVLWPMAAFVGATWMVLLPIWGLKMQIVAWLYFALMESSDAQATLGKKLIGLRVMTDEGHRLSFWRASGRYFAKYISAALWMIGFIMIAFTAKKQGLHDLMAGTVVVKKKGGA